MNAGHQAAKAERFRALHHEPSVLLLPNVWDVVSAKLYEVEGFQAVGTTSAGISSTIGLPDGQRMGIEDTARVVRRIVGIVDIPVSADIEAGYSTSPEGAADAARVVLEAGAVGINIEDSLSGCGADEHTELFEVSAQVERIKAIREMADSAEVQLVINARTDVFLVEGPDERERLPLSLDRGNAYLKAGADCVFVPDTGDLDEKSIETLVKGIAGSLNIIAGTHTPSIGRLEEIGVARLSFGPRPMRAALAFLQEIGREWLTQGTYTKMLQDKLGYDDINSWFSRR